MTVIARLNKTQYLQHIDNVFYFEIVLVTKPEKWFHRAQRETIFSSKVENVYEPFFDARRLKEELISPEQRRQYSFHHTFNLERIVLTSIEENPHGTVDLLKSFPFLDLGQKIEAYLLMYNYVVDRIDRDKERQSLLRDVGLDPVENMRREQALLRETRDVLRNF